ncbi:MAG: hypothetical protein KDC92_14135, partial [Bacteroidetes bacterium]|nr:hypothetical protein [Bacteroidota bacterium]
MVNFKHTIMGRRAMALFGVLCLFGLKASAVDYYWVNGTGDWSDIANHWATTSGGTTMHTIVPSTNDNVIFDANSFGSSTETMTISFEGFCNNFTASNLPAGVNFQMNAGLEVAGNMTIDGDIDIEHPSGNLKLTNGSVNLLNGAYYNKSGGNVYITGGNLNLGSDVYFRKYSGDLYIYSGTLKYTGTNASFYNYYANMQFHQGNCEVTATNYFYNNDWDFYLYNGSFKVNANASAELQARIFVYNGSFEYDAAATVNHNAELRLRCNSQGNYFIRTGGNVFRNVYLDENNYGTTYTLLDDLDMTNYTFYAYRNKFVSNGFGVKTAVLYMWDSGVGHVDFSGTDTVHVRNQVQIYPTTNKTINWGNCHLKFDNGTGGYSTYFYCGTNITYNDVIFRSKYSSSDVRIYATYDGVFGNIDIKVPGNYYVEWYGNVTATSFKYENTTSYNSTRAENLLMNGYTNNIGNFTVTGNGNSRPKIKLNGNHTITNLDLNHISSFTFGAFRTLKTTTVDPIVGLCDNTILVNSTSVGSPFYWNQASGTVSGDWMLLQDCAASGGATFNANSTINLGNVNGWNISAIPPTTFYWIGGNGNWNVAANWSNASGGTPGTCAIPSRIDDVIFDANSFTASGQYCTVSAIAECHNMNWNGVTAGAGLSGNEPLNIYGDMILEANMTWNKSGAVYFQATDAGNKIKTAGNTITSEIYLQGQNVSSGEWILQDKLTCTSWFRPYYGKFKSNGFDLDVYSLYNWTGATCTIDFTGTQLITVHQQWSIYPSTAITLIMDQANILFEGNTDFYLQGGNKTYNDVHMNFTGTGSTNRRALLEYNSTFRDFTITSASAVYTDFRGNNTFRKFTATQTYSGWLNNTWYFRNTQTFDEFSVSGNGENRPIIRFEGSHNFNTSMTMNNIYRWEMPQSHTQDIANGTITGSCDQWTEIRQYNLNTNPTYLNVSGTLNITNATLVNINSNGSGNVVVYNGVDLANNTGNIIWNTYSPINYYWVGGTGNWTDKSNWATSSGGTPGVSCLPGPGDNVYFDANSFSAPGQQVNVDRYAYCNSMVWNNVNYPSFAGTNMSIYGSMILDKNMTWNHWTYLYLDGTKTGNVVRTEGVVPKYLDFRGSYNPNGEWTLQDDLQVQYDIWL